jgi:hypothetical protein
VLVQEESPGGDRYGRDDNGDGEDVGSFKVHHKTTSLPDGGRGYLPL